MQLIKQVVSECKFFSYQPIFNVPRFEIEEYLSEYIIKQQENIGYGIWMKYLPFKEIDDQSNRSSLQYNYANYQQIIQGGQFIYSIEQKETMQSIMIISVNIDPIREIIEHHIVYTFESTSNTLQFTFDNEIYEGLWIMFFVYIDALQKKTTFGFYNEKQGKYTKVIHEIPLFEQKIKHIQGGLYQYIDQGQKLIILSQFTGRLSYAFTSKQEDIFIDINNCFNNFMMNFYCPSCYYVLTNYNQEMKGNKYINQTIIELDSPKYAIHGWIILNSINQPYLETEIFRITINKDYNDDHNLGDRVAHLKYYQSKIPGENGFEISTYSYQFPVKARYKSQEADKIREYKDYYSELFIQWHYIQYEFGSENNNGQPLFQIYFPSLNLIRTFSWSKSIRHFKGVQFQIFLGGDDYVNSYMQGFISEMIFTVFCESVPTMSPPCHITCNTCNGPTKQNCLSCSENMFRYLYKVENSCLCQDGYYENDSGSCEYVNALFPYISKQEFQIGCHLEGYEICDNDQIICSFGYFKYNKRCIQCPNYNDINSYTHFQCFNCITSPSEFAQNFICYEEAQTFQFNQDFIYDIKQKKLEKISYYEISVGLDQNFELKLCVNCIGKNKCKPGYYYSNNQCQKCIEGCQACSNINNCDQCYSNYYKDIENNCQLCKICESCTAFRDDIYCVTCKEKQILVIATCLYCGRNCNSCDEKQYCNYCIGSPQEYYISLDGINCNICSIDNCIYCFEYIVNNNIYTTSLDIQFSIFNSDFRQVNLGCALCKKNYFYNQITQKCELQLSQTNCDFALILISNLEQKCIIGLQNSDAIQVSFCQDIQFCLECINDYNPNNNFCIVCEDGYYSNILTGQCNLCPNICKTCIQQNKKYRDYWKWNIKAFYKFFLNTNNNHPFEVFASVQAEKDMEIICTSCLIGYILNDFKCIQDCLKGCLKCQIINGKSTCIQCQETSSGFLKSYNQYQNCLNCPANCLACLQRKESEIAKINPYFLLTSSNQYLTRICYEKSQKNTEQNSYYYDSFTQTITTCNQYSKCYNKIIFKQNLFCEYSDYFQKMSQSSDLQFEKNNLPLDRFFYDYYINAFESPSLYDYLNQISVKYVSYQFILIQGNTEECLIKDKLNIYSTLLQNVFSLQQIDISFIGERQSTKLKIESYVNLSNYTSVTFQNIQFNFGQSLQSSSDHTIINLYNLKSNLILQLINCIFTTQNGQNKNYTLQIISNIPYSLQIDNLIFKNFYIFSSNLFQFFASQSNMENNYLNLKNLTIQNSFFFNSTLFNFIANVNNLNYYSNFSKIDIINSKFIQSNFILCSSLLNFTTGIMYVNHLWLQNLQMINRSNFFQSNCGKLVQLQLIQLDNCAFIDNSRFYSSNIIRIQNLIFNNSFLLNSYLIINNVDNTRQQETQINTSEILIKSCQFLNNKYDNPQQIILIKQYQETTRFQLLLKNLLLSNNSLTNKLQQNQISYYQSTIYIECQICIIQNIQIQRGQGLPEISILNSENLMIKNFTISQDQQYTSKTLHTSIDCVQKFAIMDLYFILYIGQYQIVQIDQFYIYNCLSFNNAYIILKGYEIMDIQINESIIIQNSNFYDNTLIITDANKNVALISLRSSQQCYINISNSNFENNHLNEYFQDLTSISARFAFIKNSTFLNNRVTNSSDSIIYIKSKVLHIEELQFISNSITNLTSIVKSLLFPLTQNISLFDFDAAFPIKSNGGNGQFIVQELIIYNISINTSNSQFGGGFYIATQGMSIIQIANSVFFNTQAQLQNSAFSKGGCLYIDASLSQLTFSITNSSIDTSLAKLEGGGIYIIPSEIKNQIEFFDLKIKDCFSLKNSFFSYSSGKIENLVSNIKFQSLNFIQTQQGLFMYLSMFEKITNTQANQMANSNPLIYADFCNFTLQNCNFYSTYIQFLLYIEQADNILLANVKVINSSILNSPLFKINLKKEFPGQLKIFNLLLSNVLSFKQIQEEICSIEIQTLETQISCPYESQNDIINIKEPEFTFQRSNQLLCNQILIFSSIGFNFSLFEIDQLNSKHKLILNKVSFQNSICETCQFGLLRILGFDQIQATNMNFSYIQIENCKCGNTGCLSIIRSVDVPINENDLQINNRLLREINYDKIESQMNQQLLIARSQFKNNSALLGGSLFLVDVETLIRQCVFYFNSAQKGGAIYFNSQEKQLLILETDISFNFAQIGGGLFIISQYLQQTKELDVILINNNSTLYGNDVLEKPRTLTLSLDGGLTFLDKKTLISSETELIEQIIINPYKTYGIPNKLIFLTLPSGQPISNYEYFDRFTFETISYEYKFRIIVLDKFQKQTKGLNTFQCQLSPIVYNFTAQAEQLDTKFSLSFYNVTYNQSSGDYNLDNLIIYFNPNYGKDLVLRLYISCDFVQIPLYDDKPPFLIKKSLDLYKIFVDIQTFPCQIGEFLNYTSGGCVICDAYKNQYSVKLEAISCSFKDDSKINSIKSQMIELRNNYWRAYYYSDVIEYCYNFPLNCKGGWIPGELSCLLGHIGALCEQCDLYNVRGDGQFSISQEFQCGNCNQISYNIIITILISLWTIFSVLISVTSTVEMLKDFIRGLRIKFFGVNHIIKEASPAILIKIFTNYLQIIQAISNFQLEVPYNLLVVLEGFANPIGSMVYSLDCFIIDFSSISIIYFKIIWSLIMASFYLKTFFLLLGIAISTKLIRLEISYISTPFIYLFIYLQPNLVGQIISLLSYRKISEQYWIQGNVSYRYDTEFHQKWTYSFCLPLLILFGFLIPSFLFYGLFKNNKQLDKIIIRKTWGYLYNEYKIYAYYWETLKIIQKEAIIIVLIYYHDHIQIKASIVFLILFGYSFLTTSYKPYTTGQLNRLDTQSTIICALSIIVASCIYTAQQQSLNELILPSYIIIGSVNSFYVIKMLIQIILSYFNKLDKIFEKFSGTIIRNFPHIISHYPKIYNFLEGRKQKQLRIRRKYSQLRDYLLPKAKRILQFKKLNEKVPSLNQISLKRLELEQNLIITPQIKSLQSEVALNSSQLLSERMNSKQLMKDSETNQKSLFYIFQKANDKKYNQNSKI
ncbi:unnamed protein product [Paramecium sonneborni]|uniref:Uncharacterized protein n=1 Tax=Paramecium sonneborni TaxID=65129 RepID=A0A8S1Q6V5_9CILI|nr:unnamed protein product [Paramecium sonneborni]